MFLLLFLLQFPLILMEMQPSVEQSPREADTDGIEVRVGVDMEADEIRVGDDLMTNNTPVEEEQVSSITGETVQDNDEPTCVTDAITQPLASFVFATKKTARKLHRKRSNKTTDGEDYVPKYKGKKSTAMADSFTTLGLVLRSAKTMVSYCNSEGN